MRTWGTLEPSHTTTAHASWWVCFCACVSVHPSSCAQPCFSLHLSLSASPPTVHCSVTQPLPECHCCCSVTKSWPALWDPKDCSTPGFPVLHHLPEFAQTHVHWGSDAIQPSHPLSPLSPPALNLSQHQGLFQWVSSSHRSFSFSNNPSN